MISVSREFADDPCSSSKRENMIRAARTLISAVARLLILADMVDVHLLMKPINVVVNDLKNVENAMNQNELIDNINKLTRHTTDLINQTSTRQQNLKDPQLKDELAAARAVLKKSTLLLYTASKVYIRHPEMAVAKANRDFALEEMSDAVKKIKDMAEGISSDTNALVNESGELAAALDDFDVSLFLILLTTILIINIFLNYNKLVESCYYGTECLQRVNP